MTVQTYVAYLATVAVFFAHPPGPSQLLFMSHSVQFGVRRTLGTMAGDLTANALQMLAAGMGLVVIVAASANALTAIKWLGVLYLVWIGVRTILKSPAPSGSAHQVRARSLYWQGFLTSAANPYAVVFFGALFPQFIDPQAALAPQLLIMGLTYAVFDGVILIAFGLTASRLFAIFGFKTSSWINRVSGVLMIGAAVLLSLKDVAPTGDARAK